MTATVWPDTVWPVSSPERQGVSRNAVDAAAKYALASGGSGCIIRHGYLIKEWGLSTALYDIKSCTKGSVGITILGLLVSSSKVTLDNKAQLYYPKIGQERPENVTTGWLPEITVKQLASMTAGFDDDRPPHLRWQPGTHGFYSNDTANMLAELCTLVYHDDLQNLLRDKVMKVLGASDTSWNWRENGFRHKSVDNITSREFASGITITAQTLARIGYLYLHQGTWKNQRVISQEFINTATHIQSWNRPIDEGRDNYAMYWFSNDHHSFTGIPSDVIFAEGLGNSMVVVCPSLDLVIVRLGTGSSASNLGHYKDFNSDVIARFIKMITDGVMQPSHKSIRGIQWAPIHQIHSAAIGSDNWPMTWADDDNQYTAYGDGFGFNGNSKRKLGLGIAMVSGEPGNFTGSNIPTPTGEQIGDERKSVKASGMLMVDGVLYMLTRNADNAQLAWSDNHGVTWKWAKWKFTESFGCPTFLNAGKNYEQATDDYVYIYSHDSNSAYQAANAMILARVPRNHILDRDRYSYFATFKNSLPEWTSNIKNRGAILTVRNKCYRSSVTYNSVLAQYLMCITDPAGNNKRFRIYCAKQQWGPWIEVFHTDHWDTLVGESCSFPAKWISDDGLTLYMVFSGGDSFSVRKAVLITH